MTRAEILDTARQIVTHDRNVTHGEPENIHRQIVAGWAALDEARGDRPRDASDAALYMAWLKLVRASANPQHIDSVIDAAGYAAIAGEIASNA